MVADKLKPERTQAGTAVARQAFLYGQGDGKRVLDTQRLVEISGIGEQTIRKWIPEWTREMESILLNTTETGLSLALSAETLAKCKQDCAFYRDLAEQLSLEIKELPKFQRLLESVILRFREVGTEEESAEALQCFKAYLQTAGHRKTLIAQHLAVAARWSKLAGIDGLQDVAVTREKTMATGRAKLRLAAEAAEAGTGDPAADATPATRGRIFRRGDAPAVQVDSVPADDWDGLGSEE